MRSWNDGSYLGVHPHLSRCDRLRELVLRDCERELRSVLEDWLLLGLKLNHRLPVVGGVDLNKDMAHAELESV